MNPFIIKWGAITLVIAIASFFSYKAGFNACVAGQMKAIEEVAKDENRKVKEVIKWKEKKVVIYRDRIKKIKVAEPNACLDSDLRDIGLGGMLESDSN